MSRERLACLIAGRNLGDIVILSGTLRDLVAAGYAERYLVWTRPQMAGVFRGIRGCEVICSAFPVGTRKEFGASALLKWASVIARIRAMRPSVSIDFVGDFRERLFGRLTGSERHLHIGWDRHHPHNHLIRNPFGPGHPLVTVPADVPNVYDAHRLMVRSLTGKDPASARDPGRPGSGSASSGAPYRVGLHPFASQACKRWPGERWAGLASALLDSGCAVVAFSAPGEREALEAMFAGLEGRVAMASGSMDQFADAVASLDLMIGLDSFSVHLAHRLGVPSITINAGTPAELWAVPSGRTLAASGGCAHYPCYNVAPCRGTAYENACVNAVGEAEVLAAVEHFRLESAGSSPGRASVDPARATE